MRGMGRVGGRVRKHRVDRGRQGPGPDQPGEDRLVGDRILEDERGPLGDPVPVKVRGAGRDPARTSADSARSRSSFGSSPAERAPMATATSIRPIFRPSRSAACASASRSESSAIPRSRPASATRFGAV